MLAGGMPSPAAEAAAAVAVAAMSAEPDSVRAQRTGCSALMELHAQAVVNAGGVAAVVAAMRQHRKDAAVQRYGCAALCNLVYGDAACVQAVVDGVQADVDGGGVAAVVAAMRQHKADAALQRDGCFALANLAIIGGAACKQAIVDGGGVAVLVAAMGRHTANAEVQRWGCGALCELADGCGALQDLAYDDAACKQAVVDGGGVAAVVAAMERNTADARLQENRCSALRNLANGDAACKHAVMGAGGLAALVRAGRAFRGLPYIRGRRVLVHARVTEAIRLLLGDLGGFGPAPTAPASPPPQPQQSAAGPSSDVAALAEAQRARQRAEQRAEQEREQPAAQQQAQQEQAQQAAQQAQPQQAQPQQPPPQKQQAEEDDTQLLTVRLLALREYLERCRRIARAGKAQQSTVLWNLRISRHRLVPDVLKYFGQLTPGVAGGTGPLQLWRNTNVRFVDSSGIEEAGIDQGGLTTELHATFWYDVFKPEHALFEQGDGGRYLPRAGASVEALEATGRMLLKSIIDDHPTGRLLSRFVLEFLADSHERRVFQPSRPLEALHALEDFDPGLAKTWRKCALEMGDDELSYLALDDFEPSLGEGAVTRANVAAAVVAGCRRKLHLERRVELEALRRGFTFKSHMDLALHLARSWSIQVDHTARWPLSARARSAPLLEPAKLSERHLGSHTNLTVPHRRRYHATSCC